MAEGLPDPLGAAAAHVGARLVARHGQQRLLQEVVHIHVQCTCAHVQCTCAHVHMCTCTWHSVHAAPARGPAWRVLRRAYRHLRPLLRDARHVGVMTVPLWLLQPEA
jgi:hypothetical protein